MLPLLPGLCAAGSAGSARGRGAGGAGGAEGAIACTEPLLSPADTGETTPELPGIPPPGDGPETMVADGTLSPRGRPAVVCGC